MDRDNQLESTKMYPGFEENTWIICQFIKNINKLITQNIANDKSKTLESALNELKKYDFFISKFNDLLANRLSRTTSENYTYFI